MKKENKKPYDENGLAHGYWEEYHDNGNLWNKGSYIHGKEYGYWESYYDNGELDIKGYYIHGVKYGYWEEYFYNGILAYKGWFSHGSEIGIHKSTSFYDSEFIYKYRGKNIYRTIKNKFII